MPSGVEPLLLLGSDLDDRLEVELDEASDPRAVGALL